MYPLVKELAADGIPVAVTCRVLKLARQPYYRWLANPVTERELEQAHLANALFDAHRDDPEFGYRLLSDEVRQAGHQAADRTIWRLCRDGLWWSAFGKKKAKNGKRPGPPAHDDLVHRDFTAQRPNELWLTDITEHPTSEGKLYLCAIKDVYSNRIVGYSISDRMKSSLAVNALNSAVARRRTSATLTWPDASCTAIGAANFEAGSSWPPCAATTWSDPWARSPRPATTPPWNPSSPCCRRTSWTGAAGPPARTCGSRS